MVVFTIVPGRAVAGTLKPSDIACPQCAAKGGLEMHFTRPMTYSAVFEAGLASDDAELHCSSCNQDIPSPQWTGPLKAFMHAHLADFSKRTFRFTRFMKVLGIVLLAGFCWFGWAMYEKGQSASSGQIYQASEATITRALENPKPGMIWVVNYTRPQDIRGNTASSTEWLARVESADSETVTLRFHRAPPADQSARFAPTVSGTEDANFTGPLVTIKRTSNRTMFRILSGVEAAPRSFLSVHRIVRE